MKATVIDVIDGDTLRVSYFDLPITLRISCIDSPELRKNMGLQSREFLLEILKDKEISFEVLRRDAYNRYIADVKHGEKRIDETMVEAGLAYHWVKYSNNNRLFDLEKQAQSLKIGIWTDENQAKRQQELLRK
jgi:micrococcal nuclease